MNFSELPKKIKEWLASEKISYLIGDLNKRHTVSDDDTPVVPSVVYRVATGQINPGDVKKYLTERLKKDSEVVSSIADELKGKILKPIERDLQAIQVDIQLLTEGRVPQAAQKAVPAPPVDLRNAPHAQAPQQEPAPEVPHDAPAQPDSPFILHREGTQMPQPQQGTVPEENQVNLQAPPQPELSEAQSSQHESVDEQKQRSAERRVHYSGPVTPVE